MMSIIVTLLLIGMCAVCIISTKMKWLTEKRAWIIGGCIETAFVAGLFGGMIFNFEILWQVCSITMFLWLLPLTFIVREGTDNDETKDKIKRVVD